MRHRRRRYAREKTAAGANLSTAFVVLADRMIRRAYITGILGLALVAGAFRATPAYSRVVSSAHAVERYVMELRSPATSLSPIERFVFSLGLTLSSSETDHEAGSRYGG
jgi:hypothetical protein